MEEYMPPMTQPKPPDMSLTKPLAISKIKTEKHYRSNRSGSSKANVRRRKLQGNLPFKRDSRGGSDFFSEQN